MAFRYVAIGLLLWSLYASSSTGSGARGDGGCMIDPNGCSAGTLDADEGNGFDPHG